MAKYTLEDITDDVELEESTSRKVLRGLLITVLVIIFLAAIGLIVYGSYMIIQEKSRLEAEEAYVGSISIEKTSETSVEYETSEHILTLSIEYKEKGFYFVRVYSSAKGESDQYIELARTDRAIEDNTDCVYMIEYDKSRDYQIYVTKL